jgi:hypothetical protein
MATQTQAATHTNAVDAIRAAGVFVLAENVRSLYSGAGNGDDAFGYRRGSGASALCFVFGVNAAYNENAVMSRGAIALDQIAHVEDKRWPGKTRGAIEPALASMLGRGHVEHVSGGFRLTPKGEANARAMLAEMGVNWPTTGDAEKPAKDHAPPLVSFHLTNF